ncbi:MAG TPA: anaerobic sulfatase maturase [Thermoleophilia bacterium]
MTEERSPGAVHVMAKPTGSACNLACDYCFFRVKERLYPGGPFRMTDEVMEEYVRQYIEAQQGPEVIIAWQGGEPTMMGLDFFRRSVEFAGKYAGPGVTISHTIQTNGTLIDEEWCGFLRDNGFLVGLSMDGPLELHDRYRHDNAGVGSFDRTMQAARLMRDNRVDFNILCSVSAANVEHPREVYRFFRDELGVHWIQFIPIVERVNRDGSTLLQQGDSVTERSVDPRQWGAFLIDVFDDWLRRDVGEVHVNMFEAAFASRVGAPALACIFDETCGNAPVLEHNGDLYSCDHFVEPGHLLGNIMETPMSEMLSSDEQARFGADKRDTLPACCRDCAVLFACRGECPKNRFRVAPGGEPGLNYLCEGYKAFFEHIEAPMGAMAELYGAGRSPAEIVDAFEKAGRNDPCPCGSGKKFKHCHLT